MSESGTPEAILSTEAVIALRTADNNAAVRRVIFSHEALRAEVERLTKERAIPGRFSAEVAALHERAEAAEESCREEIARYDECFAANTRLARRVAELGAELWTQWRANHAEHCDNTEWPHPEGVRCCWPLPAVLAVQETEGT